MTGTGDEDKDNERAQVEAMARGDMNGPPAAGEQALAQAQPGLVKKRPIKDKDLKKLRLQGSNAPGLRAVRGVDFERSDVPIDGKLPPAKLYLTLDMDQWIEFPQDAIRHDQYTGLLSPEYPLGFWTIWILGDTEVQYTRVGTRRQTQVGSVEFLRGLIANTPVPPSPAPGANGWSFDDLRALVRLIGGGGGFESAGAPCI